jgi:adenylate kinase
VTLPIGRSSPIGHDSPIGRVVVLLGAPGAGKGTQAQILSKRLGLAHVATGDLFRAAVRDETSLGVMAKAYMDRGELVPDAVTIEMLLERLARPDAAAGILLDGFPRNTAQADALDRALAEAGGRVDVAPYIEVPETDLVARLGGRWICRAEGHPYHERSTGPSSTSAQTTSRRPFRRAFVNSSAPWPKSSATTEIAACSGPSMGVVGSTGSARTCSPR